MNPDEKAIAKKLWEKPEIITLPINQTFGGSAGEDDLDSGLMS